MASESFHAADMRAVPLAWPPPGPAAYQHCIRALAAELGRPIEEIASLYYADCMRLASTAIVFDYLPVIVSRHLRSLYSRKPALRGH